MYYFELNSNIKQKKGKGLASEAHLVHVHVAKYCIINNKMRPYKYYRSKG